MGFELETARLALRPLSLADAGDMWQLDQDPLVREFLGGQTTPERSRESLVRELQRFSRTGRGLLAMFACGSQFIGYCGFVDSQVDDGSDVELVCAARPATRRKGFAAEAANRVLRWGLDDLGLQRVLGRVASENTASAQLVKRLHMTLWRERVDPLTGKAEQVYEIRADPTV